MIADPEHLLEGASGTGETVVLTSNRAIDQLSRCHARPALAASLPVARQSATEGN